MFDATYDTLGLIDLSQPSLWISAAAIAFNPLFWNIVARTEYTHRPLTRWFRSPYYGCYALALTIFSLGIVRDYLYHRALSDQPLHPALASPANKLAAWLLVGLGNVLVVSSMWALGVTGTYLGDYFGILMDDKVEGFPFSLTDAPMYYGSTMSFLGTAILLGKPAGVLLTGEVLLGYLLALRFEDPFTAAIYRKRDDDRKAVAATPAADRPVTRSARKKRSEKKEL